MSTTIRMARKAKKPMDLRYLSDLGIVSYDADNLYPQNVRRIIENSKVGFACLERYIDFIEGNGITDTALSQTKVNRKNQTLDAVHSLCAQDFAYFNGFALHVNYNVLGEIVEVQHVPFEQVRLCEPDSVGNISSVLLHPDWSGRLSRNGRIVTVNKSNCTEIHVFNPNPRVVQAQIAAVGGIENYKGQIYYFSRSGYLCYPLARYTSVLTDMSTDEGLSNVSHRNVRNNFLPAGMISHFRQERPIGEEQDDLIPGEPISGGDYVGYDNMLESLMTDENCCKIAEIEIGDENEVPKFTELPIHNYDKDFEATAKEIKESIYSVFNQEVFLTIREGKLGFSGDVIKDAEDHYARKVRKEQRFLTEAYKTILEHWGNIENPLPSLPTYENLTIQSFVESVTSIENE